MMKYESEATEKTKVDNGGKRLGRQCLEVKNLRSDNGNDGTC